MWEEFKKFAMRGNVVDMAVGIIIGSAFTSIVNSLVDDIVFGQHLDRFGVNVTRGFGTCADSQPFIPHPIIDDRFGHLRTARIAGA